MRWWLLLSFIFLLMGWGSGEAVTCTKCHPKKVDLYTHRPYEKERCGVCHLRKELGMVQAELELEEVKWIAQREVPPGEFFWPLPERVVEGGLLVFWSKKPVKKEIFDLEKIEAFKERHSSHDIVRVYLCDRIQGIFTSLKLCVESRAPVEVEVVCEGGVRALGDQFATFQEVWLEGLKPGKYRCKVKGRTLTGEETHSREFLIDTRARVEIKSFPKAKKVWVNVERIGGRVFLHLKTSGVLRFKLGYVPPSKREILAQKVKDENHRDLKGPRDAGTFSCYRCHDSHSLGASHPVDVVYRPGKKVKENPEVPLFQGRVTCVSCHYPHVSKLPYLLRKQGKELCLSCHSPRYFYVRR